MASCSNIFRILIVVVNCLFMIVGLGFFVGGLFLRFGESVIKDSMSTVEKAIESSLSSAGFGTTDIDLDWVSLMLGLSLTFIFAGLFFIFVTMMGCCGSCYKIKCMLVIYVVICSILLVGQAVGVGLAYGSPKTIKDPLKTKLKNNIQSDYAGLNGTNLVSVGWNIVMQQVDCCGVDSYADFTGASNWVIDYSGKSPAVTLKTPLACCKELPTSDFTCAGPAASSTNNYLDKGCFNEIWDMALGKNITAAVVLGSLGAFQMLLILLAIAILCADDKAKKNKIRPADEPTTSSRAKPTKSTQRVKRRHNPRG